MLCLDIFVSTLLPGCPSVEKPYISEKDALIIIKENSGDGRIRTDGSQVRNLEHYPCYATSPWIISDIEVLASIPCSFWIFQGRN